MAPRLFCSIWGRGVVHGNLFGGRIWWPVIFSWHRQYQLLVAIANKALTIAPPGQTLFEVEYSQLLSQELRRRQELIEQNQAQQQAVLEDFGLWLHQVRPPWPPLFNVAKLPR